MQWRLRWVKETEGEESGRRTIGDHNGGSRSERVGRADVCVLEEEEEEEEG